MAERDRERRRRENEDPRELLYEIDEKGQQVVVKSMESTSSAYLRFTNKTSRAVDVWWRDFRGAKRHYVRLEAGTYFDIKSGYKASKKSDFTRAPHASRSRHDSNPTRCRVNPSVPERPMAAPYQALLCFGAQYRNIGGMMYRTNWNITIRVRSLRDTALLALAQHLDDPEAVYALGLPRVLADELQKLVVVFHRPRTPQQRD